MNYLGLMLEDNCINPDPNKMITTDEFSIPKCRENLQMFLSMVTYLAKFKQYLSSLIHLQGKSFKKILFGSEMTLRKKILSK